MAWDTDPRTVISRHDLTAKLLATSIVTMCLGTSITAGTGSSGPTRVFTYRLCGYLKSFTGLVQSVGNRGVGGSNILTPLMYLSDLMSVGVHGGSFPLGPASGLRGTLNPAAVQAVIIEGPRNDIGVIDPDQYVELLDLCFRQLLKHGVTPIFRTSTLQIDWTGNPADPVLGLRDNNPTFQTEGQMYSDYYSRIVALCERRGVSLVDHWKRRKALYDAGFDMRIVMHDATHPNDAGHDDDARLAALCLLRGRDPDQKGIDWADGLPVLYPDILANYCPFAGVSALTQVGSTTTGTARNDEMSDGTKSAFKLGVGQSQKYHSLVPLTGVIVGICDGTVNNGSMDVSIGANAVGNAASTGASIREAPDACLLPPDDANYGSAADITVAYNSGAPALYGVMLLCAEQTACDDTPATIEQDDAWTVGTFGGSGSPLVGKPAYLCSTVGAAMSFVFEGRYLAFMFTKTNRGKFTYSVDGADPVLVNCYANIAATQVQQMIDLGAEGTHTVEIVAAAKDPASSSNNLELGSFRTFTMIPGRVRPSLPVSPSQDMRQKFT